MKTRVERRSARRTDRKTSRRAAGRSPREGKRDTTIRRPRGSGSRTGAAAASAAGPREEITAVVEGLVSYEDFDRDDREGVQQLLTGDLTNLERWIEVRAPGKPWLAVALGMACAAIVELRGPRS